MPNNTTELEGKKCKACNCEGEFEATDGCLHDHTCKLTLKQTEEIIIDALTLQHPSIETKEQAIRAILDLSAKYLTIQILEKDIAECTHRLKDPGCPQKFYEVTWERRRKAKEEIDIIYNS